MGPRTRKPLEMNRFFREMLVDTRGATAIEYGLIVALVSVAAIVGMQTFGTNLDDMWSYLDSSIAAAK